MAREHQAVVGWFKRILAGELDHASADEKAAAVKQLIRSASSYAALLALEPIPLLDTAIFTSFQYQLMQSIARLRGHPLDDNQAREAFAMIRGRLVTPNLIIAGTKLIAFIPVLPDLWSGAIAYALTATIGELTDTYFCRGRAMSAAEINASFDRIFKAAWRDARRAKRDELRAIFRNRKVRHAIRDLKRAYRKGKMETGEALRRGEEILSRHIS